jgi:hypothetical protein
VIRKAVPPLVASPSVMDVAERAFEGTDMAGTNWAGGGRVRRRPRRSAGLIVPICAVALFSACSAPAPPPEEQERPAEPGVLFSDGFESGNVDRWLELEARDDRIEVVEDPVRSGGHAVRLTADDADFDEGENVRTQLNGPVLFDEGDEAYIGWSTYFPVDMPAIPPDVWFTFFEFHGEPFNGSPLPGTFDIEEQDGEQRLQFSRSEQYDYDSPWSAPLVKGQWTDFVVHVKFSKDDDTGFVELWLNGQQQVFEDGSTRLNQSTIMSDQDDGLFPTATNYFKADSIEGPVTIYHDAVRVAETYELAARR